jgi:hypothetical protein
VTTGSVIFMILVLALVWGGFAFCLVKLAKQEDE